MALFLAPPMGVERGEGLSMAWLGLAGAMLCLLLKGMMVRFGELGFVVRLRVGEREQSTSTSSCGAFWLTRCCLLPKYFIPCVFSLVLDYLLNFFPLIPLNPAIYYWDHGCNSFPLKTRVDC